MKIVFMGTPDFAVPSLKILFEAGYEIAAVVTVADKPAGRGQKLNESPVKKYALSQGIPVIQPLKLKDSDLLRQLEECQADLFVVVAFRMLPEVVWQMPAKGTINLHASLLPNYRGAAPINWAVINGETETGLTTFFIEKEIDTGAIIGQVKVPIAPTMTAGELHDFMLQPGADLVLESVKKIENNAVVPIPQNMLSEHRLAPKLFPEKCKINWEEDATTIYNFIRGLSPHPCAWTTLEDRKLKVYFSTIEKDNNQLPNEELPAGTFHLSKNQFTVKCGKGYINLTDIQAEGKKRMSADTFIIGLRQKSGLLI